MTTMTVDTDLQTISCQCGGVYAIGCAYYEQQRREGGSWTCPYCQSGWGFGGKGENAQLKKKLLWQQAAHDQTLAELTDSRELVRVTESRRRAERGAKTKLKNRIAKGVCPCCNRSFQNLHRHMTSQHPDWVKSESGAP